MNSNWIKTILLITLILILFVGLVACDYSSSNEKEFHVQYLGENGIASITVKAGEIYFIEYMPTKIGYEFLGWYDQEEGGTMFVNAKGISLSSYNEDHDIFLYPQFNKKEYVINLDYQGATITSSTAMNVKYGETLQQLPTNLVKENKTFTGWFTEPNMQGKKICEADGIVNSALTLDNINFNLPTEGNSITIYAGFENKKYLVTFYYGDKLIAEKEIEYGANIKDHAPKILSDGKTVVAWSKIKNDTNLTNVFSGEVTGEMILYVAKSNYTYKVNHYQVDGSNKTLVATDSCSVENITEVTPPVRHYTGYNSPVEQTVTISTSDTVINYNYIIKEYMVTFVSAGGTSSKTYKHNKGISQSMMPFPTKTNCVFAGWYTDENGAGSWYSYIPSSCNQNLTLYANFVNSNKTTIIDCSALNIKKDIIYYNDSPYTQWAEMDFNITVPNELRNMISTGRLTVNITVNTVAKVKYAHAKDRFASVTSSIYLDSTSSTNSTKATAEGGGWPWNYVEPIPGAWSEKQFTATKNISITSNNETINIKHKAYFEMDAESQSNWAGGTPEGYIDCYVSSISYYFSVI